jgi:hypothetical protein
MPRKYLLFLILLIACNNNNPGTEANTSGENSDQQTNTIKGPHAVFYQPDSIRLELLKAEMGAENFYTAADDWMTYFAQAHQIADSMHIKSFDVYDSLLRFKMDDNSILQLTVAHKDEPFGLFLFDGKSAPVQVDLSDDLNPQFENVFVK